MACVGVQCPSVCQLHKRGLCRRAVSVCPSRSWIMSKRINVSSKFFSLLVSPTILVFPYQTGWRYSDGNPPPNGGVECRWGRQKTQISGCIGHVYWCFYCVTLTGVFLGHFRISLLTHICLQLLLVVSHCSLLYLIVVYCIQYFCAAPLSNTVKGTLQIPLID